MPYHVYVPWMTNFLSNKCNPKILEIGVDVGQTLIPLTHNLIISKGPFKYTGLDVRIDDNLCAMLHGFQTFENQKIEYIKANSLEWLPDCKEQFDIVLIDGDHNYHTVSTELSYIDSIVKPDGVCICDDYLGKWAERDLFYAERPTHEGLKGMTNRVRTAKQGVRTAVNEFLTTQRVWKLTQVLHSEAVMLVRRETAMELGL